MRSRSTDRKGTYTVTYGKHGKKKDNKQSTLAVCLREWMPLIVVTLISAVLVSSILAGVPAARYVHHSEQNNEMTAAGFHFSSYELKEEAPDPPKLQSGIFTVEIRNYEVDNIANISGRKGGSDYAVYDLGYHVSASNGSSELSQSPAYGYITVKNEHDDPADSSSLPSPETGVYDSTGGYSSYTLTCDGIHRDVHHVKINADSITSIGAYASTTAAALNAATTNLTVTASSEAPYFKTLTADYTVVGITVTTEESGGGISRFVIMTNQYSGPITINWSENTFPAAGVNEYDYGWSVHYSKNDSSRRKAEITAESNTTYYFEYNESAGTSSPSVSGSWYDAENDTGGAVISAGI